MSETLTRILKRDQPKAHIVEGMVKTLFNKTDAKEAIISIKPNKLTRSGQQNKLYHSIIDQIRAETNNTKKAIKVHCQAEFLETRVEEVAKKQRVVLKSTTTLNTKEMGVYLDEVITWAENDLGIRLNLPDEWKGLVVE
jgi:hypothetical protein